MPAQAALGVGQRPAHERLELRLGQALEHVHAAAREQRRVHLERRVLGGRADQGHGAPLDVRQERVLLGLVEAVDLVDEEDRARGRGAPGAPRPRRRRPRTSLTPESTAENGTKCAWRARPGARRASSSRCPAAPRGSASGGRPPRWRRAGGARVPADAPARRTRRGSAAACARRAVPPRAGSGAPPPRTAPRRPPPGLPAVVGRRDPARPPRLAVTARPACHGSTGRQDRAPTADGDISAGGPGPTGSVSGGGYQAADRSHSGSWRRSRSTVRGATPRRASSAGSAP